MPEHLDDSTIDFPSDEEIARILENETKPRIDVTRYPSNEQIEALGQQLDTGMDRDELREIFRIRGAFPLVAFEYLNREAVARGFLLSVVTKKKRTGSPVCSIVDLSTSCTSDAQEWFVKSVLMQELQDVREEQGWERIEARLDPNEPTSERLLELLEQHRFTFTTLLRGGSQYLYCWSPQGN